MTEMIRGARGRRSSKEHLSRASISSFALHGKAGQPSGRMPFVCGCFCVGVGHGGTRQNLLRATPPPRKRADSKNLDLESGFRFRISVFYFFPVPRRASAPFRKKRRCAVHSALGACGMHEAVGASRHIGADGCRVILAPQPSRPWAAGSAASPCPQDHPSPDRSAGAGRRARARAGALRQTGARRLKICMRGLILRCRKALALAAPLPSEAVRQTIQHYALRNCTKKGLRPGIAAGAAVLIA